MNLEFDTSIANKYKSKSQQARVFTELWAAQNMYCPVCGNPKLQRFRNNMPAADLFCSECSAQFELKSGKKILNKIPDGAYSTMIQRILSDKNPHLLYLSYSLETDYKIGSIDNLVYIPNYFFTPKIIEKRPPLSVKSKRAGWTGCFISYKNIPEQGKIVIVNNKIETDKNNVLQRNIFAGKLNFSQPKNRTWIFEILNIINSINSREFELKEVYAYKEKLKEIFPDNNNIEAKIRQTLQILRGRDIILFKGNGRYSKNNSPNPPSPQT